MTRQLAAQRLSRPARVRPLTTPFVAHRINGRVNGSLAHIPTRAPSDPAQIPKQAPTTQPDVSPSHAASKLNKPQPTGTEALRTSHQRTTPRPSPLRQTHPRMHAHTHTTARHTAHQCKSDRATRVLRAQKHDSTAAEHSKQGEATLRAGLGPDPQSMHHTGAARRRNPSCRAWDPHAHSSSDSHGGHTRNSLALRTAGRGRAGRRRALLPRRGMVSSFS